MSRTDEILKRRQGSTPSQKDNSLAHRAETTTLWPRFTRVFNAIACSLGEQPPQGITRQFNTFNWNGVDEGIHDHNGSISGRTNGIDLQINLKGTTYDDQQRFIILPDGRLQLQHTKERYIDIVGTFVSSDGKNGAVEMRCTNDTWNYKAFWLQVLNGSLRLEQVVGPDGTIYDADKLEADKKEVMIPGTHTTVKRLKNICS